MLELRVAEGTGVRAVYEDADFAAEAAVIVAETDLSHLRRSTPKTLVTKGSKPRSPESGPPSFSCFKRRWTASRKCCPARGYPWDRARA